MKSAGQFDGFRKDKYTTYRFQKLDSLGKKIVRINSLE